MGCGSSKDQAGKLNTQLQGNIKKGELKKIDVEKLK